MNRLVATQTLSALISPWGGVGDVSILSPADWDEIFAVANSHYLVPALYCSLRDNSLLHMPPAMAAEYAQEVFALNGIRNKNLNKQLEGVVRCLNAVAIEPVLIKGAASLVEKWVPDPAARFMFDLDILVPEWEAERAITALLAAGYSMPVKCQKQDIHHHYPPLQKKGEPALVELHIRPLSRTCRDIVTTHSLLNNATKVSVGEQTRAWLPEPDEQLLLFFLHSEVAHENHQLGLFDIRHAWDIPWFYRHYDNSVDWSAIERRLALAGYQRELAAYLQLIGSFFSMPMPLIAQGSLRESERHLQRVCNTIQSSRSSLLFIRHLLRRLRKQFSDEMIIKRYGAARSICLQLNRIRYLFYLLYKYRKPVMWYKMFSSFRLRMKDNAGR